MNRKWIIVPAMVVLSFFLAAGSDERNEMTGFFPEIAGFTKAEPAAFYQPESLYEYIDGAAENYLSYDFHLLAVQVYKNGDQKNLTIEIYKHSDARNTFGIYSSEKPLNGKYLKAGTQGYQEDGTLNFFYGIYYIKFSGYDLNAAIQAKFSEIAAKIIEKIGAQPGMPAEASLFPEKEKISESERFILKNLFGHPFLQSGFVADYSEQGKKFQMFLIHGKEKIEVRAMLQKWLELAKQPITDLGEKRYSFRDPYNGPVIVEWRNDTLIGTVNAPETTAGILIDSMQEKIPQLK